MRGRRRSRAGLLAWALAATLTVSPALAQDEAPPDAEATVAQDEAPAPVGKTAAEEAPGLLDRAKDWASRHQIAERFSGEVDGWYPRLGGMTRGSGFAVGPGYRFRLGSVLVDASAGLSSKLYKAADLKVRWLHVWDERLEVWTAARIEDFPQEDFFGMGPDSRLDQQISYDFGSREVTAAGLLRPVPWLRTGVTVGYMSVEIGSGADADYPSIEALFSDASAPGLAAQPRFLHTTLFAEVDTRDQPGRPRSGGLYHAALARWDDRTLEQYDFHRFDLHVAQFVPLVADKSHVLIGRLGTSYANNAPGHRVPFYFLPYVGGVDTIRSFREFRFKDENAIWLTAEYNYSPLGYVTLAAFVDAGKVSADYQDIDFLSLRAGYGLGVRVHTRRQTFARLDVGTGGGEGWRVFLKFGPGS